MTTQLCIHFMQFVQGTYKHLPPPPFTASPLTTYSRLHKLRSTEKKDDSEDELGRMWKDVVVAYFEVPTQRFPKVLRVQTPTTIPCWKHRFSSDHRVVNTWTGDRLGTPRAVGISFGA
jgi:hypothetical protein